MLNGQIADNFTFREHQKKGIRFLLDRPRAVISYATGQGKCQEEGTLVSTSMGLLTLKEISELKGFSTTLTETGKEQIIDTYDNGISEYYRIEMKSGSVLKPTGEHKYRVLTKEFKIEWKRAEEIEIGDYLLRVRRPGLFGSTVLSDLDFYYLTGLIQGDGYLTEKHSICLCLDRKNDLWEEWRGLFEKYIGLSKFSFNGDVTTLQKRNKNIYDTFFSNSGKVSYDKRVPLFVRQAPKEYVSAYLRGLFDTDGSSDSNGVELGLANEALIRDISSLLCLYGIKTKIYFKRNERRGCWVLRIRGKKGHLIFREEIGFNVSYKRDSLNDKVLKSIAFNQNDREYIPYAKEEVRRVKEMGPVRRSKDYFRSLWKDGGDTTLHQLKKINNDFPERIETSEVISFILSNDCWLDSVKSKSLQTGYTRDLCIENDHSYLVDGFISHNTITFLAAFAACRKYNLGTKAIIVCDKSSIVPIMDDINDKTEFSYQNVDTKAKEDDIANVDILLCTYNRSVTLLMKLDLSEYSHLIFDEAHRLKNPESGLSKKLSVIRDRFSYVWFSTATLMDNDIMDLWGMFHFLYPNLFGDNSWVFKDKFCVMEERKIRSFRREKSNYGIGKQKKIRSKIMEIVGYKNLDKLKDLIDPFVQFHAVDFDIDYRTINITLSKGEKSYYKLASKGLVERKLRDDDAVPFSTRMHDLQLTVDTTGRLDDKNSKQQHLHEYMVTHEMSGGIVFFSYRDSLSEALEKFGRDFSIEVITGDTPTSKRKSIQDWIGPGRFIFMTKAGGQCFVKGTKVLMNNGSVKEIQNIVKGDLVMGPDSLPRVVGETHDGIDDLYKVESFAGDSYVVSEGTTLSCIRGVDYKREKRGDIVDISIKDYLKKTEYERSTLSRWKVAVKYPKRVLKIPPYILGLWLGDGCRRSSILYVKWGEEIIKEAWCNYGKSLGLEVRQTPQSGCSKIALTTGVVGKRTTNGLILDLRSYNLIKNKHIPQDYLRSSEEQRLEILAGLLDTDGYLHNKVGYEFTSALESLALDVKRLANSLGFYSRVSTSVRPYKKGAPEKVRYRVTISGDCSKIPVRLENKKAKLNSYGGKRLYRYKIFPYGKGRHYGFSLEDQDKHFLLEDGTVVHNSLNLDAVNRIAFFDTPYSVVAVSQIIGRIVRLSSLYAKFYVTFFNTKDTIDEYKIRLIGMNHNLIKLVLGGYRNIPNIKYHSPEIMKALKAKLLWGRKAG